MGMLAFSNSFPRNSILRWHRVGRISSMSTIHTGDDSRVPIDQYLAGAVMPQVSLPIENLERQ